MGRETCCSWDDIFEQIVVKENIKLQVTWLRLLKMFWSQNLPGADLHRTQHLALLAVTHNLQLIKLERKACSVIHAPCCIHCAYSSKTAGSCTWLEMSLLTAVCTDPADAALAMFLSVLSMMSQHSREHNSIIYTGLAAAQKQSQKAVEVPVELISPAGPAQVHLT